MLKSKPFKIIIGAIIVLSVLAASSIWVIFSMKSNAVDEFEYTKLGENNDVTTTKTQIDHIIENSNTSDAQNDSNYNIYIITNGVTDVADVVKTFMTDSATGFTKSIINDNRTISEIMPDGKINLVIRTVGELNALDKEGLSTALGSADLIYLYAPSNLAYTGNSAISEDLYEYLHNYAFGVNKPLIVNYELNNSGEQDDSSQTTTEGDDSNAYFLTSIDFKNSWRRTNTTNIEGWKSDTTDTETVIENYMSSNRSLYSAYQVNRLTKPEGYDTWTEYWSRNDGTSTLNILYVYGDNLSAVTDMNNVGSWMLGAGKNSVFNGLSTDLPENYNVDPVKGNDLTIESFYVDGDVTKAKKYDYIFIAPDNYSADNDIKPEVRTLLNQLSTDTNGLTYIMFGTLKGKTSTTTGGGNSGSTSENLNIDTSTNYGKLIDLSVTTTGYAKKNSVLVIGTKFMDTLAANPSMNPKKITSIVNLINKSTYREHSGSGSGGNSGAISTNAYRVLELQPAYPIDLDVAYDNPISTSGNQYAGKNLRKGNYYTIPSNVVNGLSEDEVTEGTEYYQWDLSVAKLSYALNLPANQIELVQMSTAEFVSSKADVTDSYDLIYIGGNMSAMKPVAWYGYVTDKSNPQYNQDYAFYAMYTHMAEVIDITQQKTGGLSNYAVAGSNTYRFTQLNGNDLTTDRYNQLVEYIDSGMPIVIGAELWDRYETAESLSNKLANHYLDVDSNMYALLAYLDKNKTDNKTNQLLGWENKVARLDAAQVWKTGISDPIKDAYLSDYYVSVRQEDVNDPSNDKYQTIKVENPIGKYGSADSVTVWKDSLSNELYDLVMTQSTVRPKFSIETNAVAYVSSDETTSIQKSTLVNPKGKLYWNVTLTTSLEGHEYTAYLLEDKDDNAEFNLSTEQVMKVPLVDGKGTLTYSVPSEFWGAISWKVVVLDTTGVTNISKAPANGTAAISKIARAEDDEKKKATMLEIMPISLANNGQYFKEHHDYAAQDGHTLYLDVNYQQGTGADFLYSSLDDTDYYTKNHKITDSITYEYNGKIGTGGYAFITNAGDGAFWKNTNIYSARYVNGSTNRYVGKYQTRLSIDRYDTKNDREDWTYNYIDEIADDYDLTLDIMYLDDIEYYAYMANNLTDEQRKNYETKMDENYKVYMSYMEPNYGNKYAEQTNDPYYIRANAETTLRNVIQECLNGEAWFGRNLKEDEKAALQTALNTGDYFKIFYSTTIRNLVVYSSNEAAAKKIIEAYDAYVVENDKKIDAYRAYRHYSMLSYGPEEFLRRNYDVICFGFYDDMKYGFDFSQNACDAFMSFLEPEEDSELLPGSMLITHDNMAKVDDDKYSQTFTSNLRSYIGMDRFHFTTDDATKDSFIPKYTADVKSGASKYFVTNLTKNAELGRFSSVSGSAWAKASQDFVDIMHTNSAGNSFIDVTAGYGNAGKGNAKIGYPGLTNTAAIVRTGSSLNPQYTYEEYEVTTQMNWNLDQNAALKVAGTTKATQINRGVVTSYPFYIPSDLRVSPTHSQAYALDLEDNQVTAWYTLAADNQSVGGNSDDYAGMKANSSTYAAAPKDATNNYYIYSKGNVTYCGAGHAAITGEKRDNNDERRLFINVLVNLANKSQRVVYVEDPDIVLYDPDGTTVAGTSGSKVVKYSAEDGYYINVTSGIDYPEFAFGIDMKGVEGNVTDVQVFYDLDYNVNKTATENNTMKDDANHVKVTLDKDVIEILNAGNVYKVTKENVPSLVTKRSYFDAYGGDYTYLVVRVKVDSQDEPLVKRIKVRLVRDLLDLT